METQNAAQALESDLGRLERLIQKLEGEYDQFFSGQIRGIPLKTQSAIQGIIRNHSSRAIQNPGLRFRYANLVARYNSFRKVWERRIREQEEGRLIGRPCKSAPSRRPSPPGSGSPPFRREFVEEGGSSDGPAMEEIFQAYRQMRVECGESTERLRLESFSRILKEKIDRMQHSKNCERVEIRLLRDKNTCRILIRPYGDDGG